MSREEKHDKWEQEKWLSPHKDKQSLKRQYCHGEAGKQRVTSAKNPS